MTQPLSVSDAALLQDIASVKHYSLVRFELRSSRESSLRSVALPDVHLLSAEDTMDEVKERGAALRRLQEAGLVTLDYRPAVLAASAYAVYARSSLYALFCGMVREGAQKPGFLFDTPYLKKGRAVLTARGQHRLYTR